MNVKKSALVGIDVSNETFNAHFGGKDCKYKNTRVGWHKLVKEAPVNSTYVMESTGYYHYRLASYLHGLGLSVIVLNPYFVHHWLKSRGNKAKTDKRDARGIFSYALENEKLTRAWEPMSPLLSRARTIVTLLSSLSKLRQSSNNVNHSISLVVGKKDNLLDAMNGVLDVCREQEKALELELAELVKKLYPTQYSLLMTIPGLGSKSVSVFLVCCRGFADFATYRQLTSYVGLGLKVEDSGTSVRRRQHITKTGNNYLRSLLFMCAMSAMSCCVPCKNLYQRLVSRGKLKELAIVAVMHRLVKIAFGVVRSNEPYRGNLLPA